MNEGINVDIMVQIQIWRLIEPKKSIEQQWDLHNQRFRVNMVYSIKHRDKNGEWIGCSEIPTFSGDGKSKDDFNVRAHT